jgi:hypothetical protein
VALVRGIEIGSLAAPGRAGVVREALCRGGAASGAGGGATAARRVGGEAGAECGGDDLSRRAQPGPGGAEVLTEAQREGRSRRGGVRMARPRRAAASIDSRAAGGRRQRYERETR